MKSGKKNKEVHSRFTEEEFAQIQVQATAIGKSVREYIRHSALNTDAVYISDGKKVAQKIGKLHNQIVIYHNDIKSRIQALQEAVEAHSALLNSAYSCSSEAQATRRIFEMRIKAAVDTIQNAYSEYENRTEEVLHTMLENITQTGEK